MRLIYGVESGGMDFEGMDLRLCPTKDNSFKGSMSYYKIVHVSILNKNGLVWFNFGFCRGVYDFTFDAFLIFPIRNFDFPKWKIFGTKVLTVVLIFFWPFCSVLIDDMAKVYNKLKLIRYYAANEKRNELSLRAACYGKKV